MADSTAVSSPAPVRERKDCARGLTPPVGLGPSWYLSQEVFEAEQQALFSRSPRYVGHEAMIPAEGSYCALSGVNRGRLLVRHEGQPKLLSNVCRHRQALMLEGCGQSKSLVCPVHHWAYDLCGRQVAAPQFDKNPGLDLASEVITGWRGLLFAGSGDPHVDLAPLDDWPELEVRDYRLDRVETDEYPVNWKAIMEVFLEDYHIAAVHPGFRTFVDSRDVRRGGQSLLGEQFFVEKVHARWPQPAAGSPHFELYQRLLSEALQGEPPPFGAIWLCYFPNYLIEWYPFSLIINAYEPLAPERTRVCSEYYFAREVLEHNRPLVDATHAVFHEVATEDEVASERLHAGRRALHARGIEEAGPYQQPMEQGVHHFHEFLRERVSR